MGSHGRPRLSEAHRHDDRGMTTAEYAVGTVAVIGFGGILAKALTDPTVQAMLVKVIAYLVNLIWGGGDI